MIVNHVLKSKIDNMVEETMFALVKAKTGINSLTQIKNLEFVPSFKNDEGVTKISAVYVKKKILPMFEKISLTEIKLSGATSHEFVNYLRKFGAYQVLDKKTILEKI